MRYLDMEHKYEYVTGKSRLPGCLFCLAASGEVDDLVVYRGDRVVVLLNKYPYNTGHLLVAPARHVEDLSELEPDELAELFSAVRDATIVLKRVLDPDGFNIGINLGRAAGASIRHLHVHVVPRRFGEYNFMEVVVGAKSVLQKPETIRPRLKAEFERLRGGKSRHRFGPMGRHHRLVYDAPRGLVFFRPGGRPRSPRA